MLIPIIVLVLLIILLGGGGVALHYLWILLIIGIILWLLGFVFHPWHRPGMPRRWW